KAAFFADELSTIQSFFIDRESVQTNIVLVDVQKTGKTPQEIITVAKEHGILISGGTFTSFRAVMHLDVTMDQVKIAVQTLKKIFH
ncbi:MAG: threonine aldolase, partial [Bacteroidetes bacterium]|nr:threonine aldolase [Bacteroidota bacterium]